MPSSTTVPSTTLSSPASASAEATVSFAELGVPANLIASLAAGGIDSPFPIQVSTLPDTLAGRDVLGRGRTGSGKTIAFSLPLVARLAGGKHAGPNRPRALVLAPTRELANQITETLSPLAKAARLSVTTIFGGVSQGKQVSALNGGVDIVVACPGRLEDLMGQRHVRLDAVEIAVLDEADHMADLGFLPGVKRILDATPKGGQRLLFSATLDNGVDILVKRYLDRPITHSVDPANSPVSALTHHLFEVSNADEKKAIVERLASGSGRRLLFMRTKHQARQMARKLTEQGIPAADLHGNLSQNARERNLAAFHSGEVRVMVATDIAARGIHVDDIDLVVHVDPPAEHKAYLHRSGRTARAGAGGDVVTLILPEQRGDVRQLTKAAKIAATPQRVKVGDAAVTALVGEVAAHVDPTKAPDGAARKPEAQPRRAPKAGGAGGRGGRGGQGGRSGAPASGGRGQGARGERSERPAGSRTSSQRDGARSEGQRDGQRSEGGQREGQRTEGVRTFANGVPRRGQRTAAKGPRGESRGQGVRGNGTPADGGERRGGAAGGGRASGGRSGGSAGNGGAPRRGGNGGRSSAPTSWSTSTPGSRPSGMVQMSERGSR